MVRLLFPAFVALICMSDPWQGHGYLVVSSTASISSSSRITAASTMTRWRQVPDSFGLSERSPLLTRECTNNCHKVGSLHMMMDKKKKKNSGPVRAKNRPNRAKPKGFAGALRDLQLKNFNYAGSMRPGRQTPQRIVVDESILKPDYHADGMPKVRVKSLPWIVEIKSPRAIVKMREAGKVAREILDLAGKAVKPGVTTDAIDALVHEETLKRGAYPSPLNYHGFPKSCCTSVNEVICHGIPDDRALVAGDIINVDITCYLDGYHGDCSEMFYVGDDMDDNTRKLLQTTYDCWISACQIAQPGRDYKDIGGIIEDYVTERGFTTVRNFCGHGIGTVFHTNPNILHYKNEEPNGQMGPGHTFTIEPMICEGSSKALTWPDEWTATTIDGKRSAQFEHTLLICEDGVEALTGKTETSSVQFWERESQVHKGFWLGTTEGAKQRMAEINGKLGLLV